jgi:hypothetical protein
MARGGVSNAVKVTMEWLSSRVVGRSKFSRLDTALLVLVSLEGKEKIKQGKHENRRDRLEVWA